MKALLARRSRRPGSRVLSLVVAATALAFAGCSSTVDSDSAAPSAPPPQASPTIAPEPKPQPMVIPFIDAYGVERELVVDPTLPQNPYDSAAFTEVGGRISYDDDYFSSRFGIDVSEHQGEIDWAQVAAAGVEFAFLRVGYRGYGEKGIIAPDQMFAANVAGAQANGIDIGVYFFSQAISEAEAVEEAQFVLTALAGTQLQLPVAFDPETIEYDTARTDDLTREQVTANTLAFAATIVAGGYEAMIYANLMWQAMHFDLAQLDQFPIWYADYSGTAKTPYEFEYWQYTNGGEIAGINTPVDLNIQLVPK